MDPLNLRLKRLELFGFKSFAKKTEFVFQAPITAIVGPNGSGKSNAAEACRWVLGERSLKSLRGGRGEDLIWNGGPTAARAARAAVSLTFDNGDRFFNLDYAEVTISREVFRDGANVYAVNGSVVRYRDLMEILSDAGLGVSDHFIINQGETDHLLSAKPPERRVLVADALGLRRYQWKIEESRKKLIQTKINLEQAASLRREIAPHLRFLKKQMEKIEQANALRRELKALYFEYLKREEVYLESEKRRLTEGRKGPERELVEITSLLKRREAAVNETKKGQTLREQLAKISRNSDAFGARRNTLTRRLGRLEGMMEARQEAEAASEPAGQRDFSYAEVSQLTEQLTAELDRAGQLSDVFSLKNVLSKLKKWLADFLVRGEKFAIGGKPPAPVLEWSREKDELAVELERLARAEKELAQRQKQLEEELAGLLEAGRAAEREYFSLASRRSELLAELGVWEAQTAKWQVEQTSFERELTEAKALVDQEVMLYKNFILNENLEPRATQEERRRRLERLKIKLEDSGAGSDELLKEHSEVSERDEFLAREIADLEQAAVALEQVIADLLEKIDREFDDGLSKINRHFQEFFDLMFDGGTAQLVPAKEIPPTNEENVSDNAAEIEAGLEVKISLPRKKIRGLDMLSGGERALVSIALLFALSQVNPPPFLVLDETDAALDEANSRKYGEMVENLSRRSQLLLVTHNRETMSRAGVIYGVTMGRDGISRLLSIKFNEAARFAK